MIKIGSTIITIKIQGLLPTGYIGEIVYKKSNYYLVNFNKFYFIDTEGNKSCFHNGDMKPDNTHYWIREDRAELFYKNTLDVF